MAVSLLPWLDQFFTDSNGNPLTGGTVETYAAGTSTPKTTWSDPAGTVANANPVPLGSNGRPTSGGIYGTIGEGYKIIVKNSAGVEQPCSRDNVFFPAVTSGGSTGNFLDKVTTDPQGVAGAVTWDSLQSFGKGLNVFGIDAAGWSLKIPTGSWIMPQTPGAWYLTSHTNPSPAGDGTVLQLGSGGSRFALGDGTAMRAETYLAIGYAHTRAYAASGSGEASVRLDAGSFARLQHTDASSNTSAVQMQWTNSYMTAKAGQVTIQDGVGIKLTPSGTGKVRVEGLATGTATQLLAANVSGDILSYPLGSGGFVGLSGHNQATTPWSIGNGLAWVSTDAGYWFDQTGTYQNWIKGNLLIDQGVSNVATLYRQSFSVGQTICLMFDGQDSLGAQVRYAETCGQIAGNTAGAVNGEWYTKIAVAGVMTDRIRADQTGGVLTGAWNITGALTSTTAKFTSTVSISGATGTNRVLQWETSNSPRWAAYITSDAESGGNAGSKWALARYTDAGAVIDNAVVVDRATAGVTLIGALILPASTATLAPLTIPTGVAVTSPATGNVWSAAADQMQWRSGANSRSFSFLEVAQTYSAVKTFSATPVISSTTASTTAGAIYKRTNYGHVGYEAGMAQEFLGCIYTGPVGTALTNSVVETDVTGGTALFGTRTLSTSVMQNGVKIRMQTKASFTNSAANTLTLRIKFGATTVATITITSVVASATPIDIWCDGVATAAPGASVETLWTCGVEGATAVVAATAAGTIQNLATSTATALSMTAQWGTALATSIYHTKATEIILQ